MKRFLRSLRYALSGVGKSLDEGNMKIHVSVAILVVIAGLYFGITKVEWLAVWLCFGLVWVAEIINTAIEDLCDIAKEELKLTYEKTKWPRDLAAGAVLVATIVAITVGLWIFMPRVFHF